MRLILSLGLAAGAAVAIGLSSPASAQTSAAADHEDLRALGAQVQPERMRADIQTMVVRGATAARATARWRQ